MKKISANFLGIYDLVLALGAIFIGMMMVSSNKGILAQYPKEWLTKVPFKSFVIPGIIAILLFGLGNVIAAIFSFKKENKNSWFMSSIMGGLLFMSLIFQVLILGELYLATVEFMILSIFQLCLSGYAFAKYRKNQVRANI
jgi:NADH:ubiquinone oxidoreductase subunit 6 (subunit J)